MKSFFGFYLVHFLSAVAVTIFLSVVGFLGGFVVSLLPFFQIQALVLLQIGLFIPFRQLYGTQMAKVTGTISPMGENVSYGLACFMVHFWSIAFLLMLLNLHFTINSISMSGMLEEELMAIYNGSSVDLSSYGWLFSFLVEQLVKFPVYFLGYLEKLPLKLFAYGCLTLFMCGSLEQKRVLEL